MSFTAIYLQIILFSLQLSLAISKTEGIRDHSICFVIFVPISRDNTKFRYCGPLILYFTGRMCQSVFSSFTEKLLNQKYEGKKNTFLLHTTNR